MESDQKEGGENGLWDQFELQEVVVGLTSFA
jgi:hypothetical protein